MSSISIFLDIPIDFDRGNKIESTPDSDSTFSIKGSFTRFAPLDINDTSFIGPEAVVEIVEYVIVASPAT